LNGIRPSCFRAIPEAAAVSRWAKEGKLPFLRTLGGHRRYPAVQIRQLADEPQVRTTA
jgi:predicted site-specific integrase-resolvase